MPKRKPRFARIAITLPPDDLATADRLARQQARPRSWVIAEAVRRYAATSGGAAPPDVQSRIDAESGLGASRLAQLRADLELTPEARVRAAEETARVSFRLRPALHARVLGFERYEDYLEWKRREARSGGG
ncbi:MAG: CopG family transcriptional regulator [Gemmatimonadaceae bacterium]